MLKAYAVTGFLGAGKTTLLNSLLKARLDSGRRLFFLQLESGDKKLEQDPGKRPGLTALAVSKRNWDSRPEEVAAGLRSLLIEAVEKGAVDELWIEWNGALPFAELLALFSRSRAADIDPTFASGADLPDRLYGVAELAGVITVVDTPRYDAFMAQAENPLPGFLAAADVVVLRGPDKRRVRRQIKRLVPAVHCFALDRAGDRRGQQGGRAEAGRKAAEAGEPEAGGTRVPADQTIQSDPAPASLTSAILKKLTGKGALVKDRLTFLLPVLMLAAFLVAYSFLRDGPVTADRLLTVFLGILLQAFPFLLIGILISSAVQILLPPGFVTRLFPKGRLSSLLFALLAGFCLPVCDCASIPVFHSLLRKGVPVSAAVTFMVASPIINPIVILSTYHAFGGDWRVVGARFGLGLVAGLVSGLLMSFGRGRKTSTAGLAGRSGAAAAAGGILRSDRLMVRCSIGTGIVLGPDSTTLDKVRFFCRHVVLELFDIVRYLLVAALLSSAVQIMVNLRALPAVIDSPLIAILMMMALAFLLSLCSSSDAVVARSFSSSFPPAALMAFLIYGPVMDMKNLIMLSGGSRKSFMLRLFLTVTAVMFLLAVCYHYFLFPLLFKSLAGPY